MSQKFGGRFSPGAKPGDRRPDGPAGHAPRAPVNPFHGRKPSRTGARVNTLFVLPFAFAATAFFQPPAGLALDLGAFALLMLAAWLTREGEIAQEAYEARSVARRPAIPRKMFGAVLMGAGIGLGAHAPGSGPFVALLLGGLGAVLHLAAFGPDPLRDKGMEGVDRFQTDRVARAVEEAERHITTMREAARRSGDREVMARVERFATTARALFRSVESDPRDLTAARRYLSVYLQGARDATVQFAEIQTRRRDDAARDGFVALLDDLDSRFAQRTEALMSNDRADLEVEIEVLRERLAQDAPPPPAPPRTCRLPCNCPNP